MTYRRVLDDAIVTREVVRRDRRVVHYLETRRAHGRASKPRPHAAPIRLFDTWALHAQLVTPTTTT